MLVFNWSIFISIVCIISYNSNKVFNFVGLSSEMFLYFSNVSLFLSFHINSFDGSNKSSLLYIGRAIILTLSSFVALLKFSMSQKLLACICVVSFFALNVLYSCGSCDFVLGAGLCWLFLLYFSLFINVASGVMIPCELGPFCNRLNLLFVAKVRRRIHLVLALWMLVVFRVL